MAIRTDVVALQRIRIKRRKESNKRRIKPVELSGMINNRLKMGTYSDYSIFLHFRTNVKRGIQHKISNKKKKAE
ncbi:hypothetical protein P2H57_06380 [Citrobacter freundii]|uniref:hypothetical protein n=1 Tax=unclassified Citrobacter TaxID=2644389 RepID=UPI001184D68D|nr:MULTISPECIES: hypothetical protein [Citrobacter]MCQ7056998.1 hypothetical protein [Escherichia coli]MDK2358831.1 hypothetical protein [Citrobacter freundii]MDM2931735.1 hypothetical protein [Citrobacter sp. Cm046]MDM2944440.1 hypothetical protein [Citrobacter sp. Cm038]HAU4332888.1 hypothetical protein [Citrobacter freundii]